MERRTILSKKELETTPINIGEGIYWVGFSDNVRGLHCNPYLIVEKDEAILIDGGSRNDFTKVMIKILRTGIEPRQIKRLIYHHYDPDLCGSILQFEQIINSPDLKIISHKENNVFIHYYSPKIPKLCIRDMNYEYTFKSGRRLKFYHTPYSHSPGSFMTYDEETKTLFSSDIFGCYDTAWELFLKIPDEFKLCRDLSDCILGWEKTGIYGIKKFAETIMTSNEAFSYALDIIDSLDVELVAPQHGSIIMGKDDIKLVTGWLRNIKGIGINHYLSERNK